MLGVPVCYHICRHIRLYLSLAACSSARCRAQLAQSCKLPAEWDPAGLQASEDPAGLGEDPAGLMHISFIPRWECSYWHRVELELITSA